MWNAIFGWQEILIKYFAGVSTCEVSGFGNRVENLKFGGAVDGKVVDGFMGYGIVCKIWSLRKHALHSFGVRSCKWLVL